MSQNKNMFKKIKKFFLDALFPVSCLNCGNYGEWICNNCFKKLKLQEKTADDYELKMPELEDIFIAGNYDEDKVLSLVLRRFKYNHITELASILGRFLSFFWNGKLNALAFIDKEFALELENALIIPVPLSKGRLKERGFNQAEELAKYLAQEFSYEIYYGLKRKNSDKHQARMDKEKRLKNIKGSFYIKKEDALRFVSVLNNRTIIIVDDIVTSGATLNEVAKTLKEAGAKKVYALAVAKG